MLKNITVHKKFTARFAMYILSAALFGLRRYMRAAEIPISTKSMVHTIGKTVGGGVSGGLFISSKSDIEPEVTSAERPPTASAEIINMTVDFVFFFTFLSTSDKKFAEF